MRLEGERLSGSMRGQRRQAGRASHRAGDRVRRRDGQILQRRCRHLGNLVIANFFGAPDRGSSDSRFAANRSRHSATVTRVMPRGLAMALLVIPSGTSSTISASGGSSRPTLRRRSRDASSTRS